MNTISIKRLWIYMLITLLAMLAISFSMKVFLPTDRVLAIEMAGSSEDMSTFISGNFHGLFWNTVLDFGFILTYSLLTFFSMRLLLRLFDLGFGGWVYFVSFIAGFFDAMENTVLMSAALRHREDFSYFFYYVVRIKWALSILPFMTIIVALLYGLIYLIRFRKRKV